MNSVVRAICLLVLLAVMALLLARAGQEPLPVSTQWGTLKIETTAPVAITLLLLLLLAAFYLGQFGSWLGRAAGFFTNRQQTSIHHIVEQTAAALALGDTDAARKHLNTLPAHTPLPPLAAIQSMQVGQLPVPQAETLLTHPTLAPVAALYLSRLAATQGNWNEVRRLTTIGRQHLPANPALLALQFKALVNLNSPEAAQLLPALKPHLGATRTKLLTTIIQGPTSLNARTLGHPFTKAFQTWLTTPSEVLPDEETAT